MQYTREFISEHEVTWSRADPMPTLDAVQRAQR